MLGFFWLVVMPSDYETLDCLHLHRHPRKSLGCSDAFFEARTLAAQPGALQSLDGKRISSEQLMAPRRTSSTFRAAILAA